MEKNKSIGNWQCQREKSSYNNEVGKKVMEMIETHAQGQMRMNPYAKLVLGKCYQCNQLGCHSNDCLRRKWINIIEHEKYEEKSEDGKIVISRSNGDNDANNLKDGQILVILRMMLALKKKDTTQCHQLF